MSIRYPLFLLIAAASLSLAAQLAVAQRSVSGWLLSAVPALAFMALVKLVFTGNGQGSPVGQDQAVTVDPPTDPAATVEPTPAPPAIRPRPAGLAPVPASAFSRANGAEVFR